MKILVQHAAQDLPNMIEGEPLLPDDHRNPRLGIARGQTRRLGQSGESPRRFRKKVSPVAIVRFFPEARLPPPDSIMPYRNEGMSESHTRYERGNETLVVSLSTANSFIQAAWPVDPVMTCFGWELASTMTGSPVS
jgi:hypothetical protein